MKRISLLLGLALVVSACLGSDFTDSIEGSWALQSGTVDGQAVTIVDTHPITMTLDGRNITGTAACNGYGGEYELSSNGGFRLRDGVAATEMACDPPESMESERQFIAGLVSVNTIELTDTGLTMRGDGVELVFTPGAEGPDVGALPEPGADDPDTPVGSGDILGDAGFGSWQLVSGTIDGAAVPLVATHPITLTVDSDTFGGTAACNGYGGFMPASGESLREIAMTAMACGPTEVMDSESAYMEALSRVTASRVEDGALVLTGDGVELVYQTLQEVAVEQIQGKVWVLESYYQDDMMFVIAGDRATLEVFSDGSFIASTGCRTLTGRWIASGAELVFPEMAAGGECPAELQEQDSQVISRLGDGFRVEIAGDILTTWSPGNEGLVYRAEA